MDNSTDSVRLTSSNPDYDTTFYKGQMQEEMQYLGMPEDRWMEYALNRTFEDDSAWDTDLCELVCSSKVIKITVELDGGVVTIAKL